MQLCSQILYFIWDTLLIKISSVLCWINVNNNEPSLLFLKVHISVANTSIQP
jgi:hypothetical protein